MSFDMAQVGRARVHPLTSSACVLALDFLQQIPADDGETVTRARYHGYWLMRLLS